MQRLLRLALVVVFLGASATVAAAQDPVPGELLWVSAIEGRNVDTADVAIDDTNNIYLTGTHRGSITFDPGPTEITIDGEDVYLARFDSDGALIWAVPGGGTLIEIGDGGEIYTAASFRRGFVSRYDDTGELIWSVDAPAASVSDIAVSDDGTVFISGRLSGTETFGTGQTTEVTVDGDRLGTAILAAYDADGTLLWIDVVDSADFKTVTVSDAGVVAVAGTVIDEATLGASRAAPVTITNSIPPVEGQAYRDRSLLMATYSVDGSPIWARGDGTPIDGDTDMDLTFDADDGLVVVGAFTGEQATFGAGQPNETVLDSPSGQDPYIASYTATGDLKWVTSILGFSGEEEYMSVAIDGSSDIVFGGYIESQVFAIEEGMIAPAPEGDRDEDPILVKYDSDGTLIWANRVRAFGTGFERITDVAVDRAGDIVAVGFSNEGAIFGEGDPTETSVDVLNLFIAKYSGYVEPAPEPVTTTTLTPTTTTGAVSTTARPTTTVVAVEPVEETGGGSLVPIVVVVAVVIGGFVVWRRAQPAGAGTASD